ncbi:MAG: Ig domain-containing protein [Clostridia bacterium]|nr:Ig domain-containing protein [Clostridia bacterium]
MSINMKRWIAMILMACLMTAMSPAALPEGEAVEAVEIVEAAEPAEAAEAAEPDEPAEAAEPAEPAEPVEPAEAAEAPVADAAPVADVTFDEVSEEVAAAPVDDFVCLEAEEMDLAALDEAQGEDPAAATDEAVDIAEVAEVGAELVLEELPGEPYAYAWTLNEGTQVCRDDGMTDVIHTLASGEAVLVAERLEGLDQVAFNTLEGVVEGYVAAADLRELDAQETENLLDLLAGFDALALYRDDINWPLPPEARNSFLAAADFERLSNDTQYVVQGKTITANMVGDHSDCWSWARALYKIIWGVKFDNNFVGEPVTGHSLIRNLTDEERQLTGENLRRFMKQSVPGCTLRICSCPRNCSNIDNDGCPKHEKHSLMVIEIGDEGFVVMDNMTGSGDHKYSTRYYTYDNFAKHWAKYKMVKYIKWPNAPEFDKTRDLGVKPESVTLSETSVTVRAEQTYALNATVMPENAEDKTLTWTSSDPFVAYMDNSGNLVSVGTGKTTITATTTNGINASAEVTVVPKDYKATGVSLDQTGTVYVKLGSTLQLNASVAPAYANPDVAWKSSKKKVAAVSKTGLVTPRKTGTTTVTVTTASKKKAKVKVKVVKGTAAGKVTLDKTGVVEMKVGETLKLNATVSPATNNPALKWKSSKSKVAAVSQDGTVTAKQAGTAVIGVMTANKKKAKVKIKVVDTNAPSAVTLDKTGIVEMKVGETLKLNATLSPESAQTALKWKSTKKKVAAVSQDGTVTAKKPGTATVGVVTSNKKKAKVKIRVTK